MARSIRAASSRTPGTRNPGTRRIALWCCAALLVAGVGYYKRLSVHARLVDFYAVCLSPFAEELARDGHPGPAWAQPLLARFAKLDRYRHADRSLPPTTPDRVIFYGDSITDFWLLAWPQHFFPGRGYLDRGIAGQATPELLWRFRQDVLDLHPGTVVLLAGANDILLASRYISPQETRRNLETMVQLARRQHRAKDDADVLPVDVGTPAKRVRLTAEIRALNEWLRAYAATQHLSYVDYYDAMADPQGFMRQGLTVDGLHPNGTGYDLMAPLAQQAMDHAP
jgi:lysophospholipase L1-like esterase